MVSRPKKTFPEHIVPKLEINAPALVFLALDDSVTKDFAFQSLSSSAQVLRIASLHFSFFLYVIPTDCIFPFSFVLFL